MIGTYLSAALGIAKRIPREVYYLLGVGLFLWWFAGMQFDRGYGKRSDEYEAARLEAVQRAREADAEGISTAETVRNGVDAGNDRARDAARDSEDPLRDGLNTLGGR